MDAQFPGIGMAEIGRSGRWWWQISISSSSDLKKGALVGGLMNILVNSDPWGNSFHLGTKNSKKKCQLKLKLAEWRERRTVQEAVGQT